MKCDFQIEVKLDKPKIDFINGGLIYSILTSCGKCYNCKQNKANGWSFRIAEQLKESQSAYFVTLTYVDPPMTEKGFMTLDKKHVQDFIKRLRKIDQAPVMISADAMIDAAKGNIREKIPIKYFAAGEYGEKNKRPHYHLIIFNVRDQSSIDEAWKVGEYYEVKEKVDSWEKFVINEKRSYWAGSIHIDKVNINTIDYTVKYVSKDQQANLFKAFDGIKEFNLQSKDLGKTYLRDDVIKFHKDNEQQNYLTTKRGYKIPIPKYYRDQIYKCYEPRIFRDLVGKESSGPCGECGGCIARWNSISYIKNKMVDKEEKDIKQAQREGNNYDQIIQQQKEARKNKLKNPLKKRNID